MHRRNVYRKKELNIFTYKYKLSRVYLQVQISHVYTFQCKFYSIGLTVSEENMKM